MVVVPAGCFLFGTICIKSNVELHLQSAATLLCRSPQNPDSSRKLVPEGGEGEPRSQCCGGDQVVSAGVADVRRLPVSTGVN